MKFEIEIPSDGADAIVIAWLKDYRRTCIDGAQRPLDTADYVRTINAIDEILRTSMTKEDWDTYASRF